MSDDIEKFLRQAAAKRRNRPQADIEFIQPQKQQPIEAEIVPAQPVHDSGVSSHVQQHLDTEKFDERASHMGEHVGLADEKMEAHLHEEFDHVLGKLQDTSQGVEEPSTADQPAVSLTPTDIVHMFHSPHTVRQAILMSEILKRPEDRWKE